MSDLISRQAAIDVVKKCRVIEVTPAYMLIDKREAVSKLVMLPPAQPDGWLEQNKDKILQAGMEGQEIDFRIGGRLFAIREKAQ